MDLRIRSPAKGGAVNRHPYPWSLRGSIVVVLVALCGAIGAAHGWADDRGRWEEDRHGDVHRFREQDLRRWQGGHWVHDRHAGRLGWWWVVGGVWYFYPAPVYPYPDPYVPPDGGAAGIPVVGSPAVLVLLRPCAGVLPLCHGLSGRMVAGGPAANDTPAGRLSAAFGGQLGCYPTIAPHARRPPPKQACLLGVEEPFQRGPLRNLGPAQRLLLRRVPAPGPVGGVAAIDVEGQSIGTLRDQAADQFVPPDVGQRKWVKDLFPMNRLQGNVHRLTQFGSRNRLGQGPDDIAYHLFVEWRHNRTPLGDDHDRGVSRFREFYELLEQLFSGTFGQATIQHNDLRPVTRIEQGNAPIGRMDRCVPDPAQDPCHVPGLG